MRHRLAIISSHPIQYYAPWFRYIARETDIELKVFYLWDFGVIQQRDSEFEKEIAWDIPLLEGYSHEFVPNTSKRPETSHFWGLLNPTLKARVEAYRPTAVLMMNYNYAGLYRFIWQWKASLAPLLFRGDSHRLIPTCGFKEKLRRQWISTIYRKFQVCLYVGKANRQYFSYHGVPDERLFFTPHAVENERFFDQVGDAAGQASAWRAELGIPKDYKVVLFAGKFSQTKRPLDLLNAFLVADVPKSALLFVGAGPLESALKQTASACRQVYFAPFQNQTLMPRTYAAGDVFVLPSYGETWGLAVNEAMCLGRAIITSDYVGCAADLVESGKNGLTFPAGNVAALAEALSFALSDAERLKEWGDASFEKIRRYSYAQTTAGLEQALVHLQQQAGYGSVHEFIHSRQG